MQKSCMQPAGNSGSGMPVIDQSATSSCLHGRLQPFPRHLRAEQSSAQPSSDSTR
ncbi:hypothetical protein PtA15_9A137 [Puccinia triticina]|uniref:Uncharacterized protein n=1 Tax=Puccinia triticina TaxID=208348 RepID=A0ABY7CU87_9BASI|nr:uncharacterized protein PtA15_9A137 [Puccinia triticina]WAQ88012.1 hypothetical protein PtA15_9A137 [Puccinia triticina]